MIRFRQERQDPPLGMRNMLALNIIKTEVIHFSTRCCGQDHVTPRDLIAGGVSISHSHAVCNLGVIVDLAGTMSTHIYHICQNYSNPHRAHCWKNRIISLFTQSTTLRLIHGFVICWKDHCNCLLFGLPIHEIKKPRLF